MIKMSLTDKNFVMTGFDIEVNDPASHVQALDTFRPDSVTVLSIYADCIINAEHKPDCVCILVNRVQGTIPVLDGYELVKFTSGTIGRVRFFFRRKK